MSATTRGIGNHRPTARLTRAPGYLLQAIAGTVKRLVTELYNRGEQKRLGRELRHINDHALRDIGLVRDPFSGIILSNGSGELIAMATAIGRRPARLRVIEERRNGERRATQRGGTDAPVRICLQEERRTFDRRSSRSGVLDCRDLFGRRNSCISI